MIAPSSFGLQSHRATASRQLFALAVLLAIYCVCLGKFILTLRAHGVGIRSTELGTDVFFYLVTTYEPGQLFALAGFFFIVPWLFLVE